MIAQSTFVSLPRRIPNSTKSDNNKRININSHFINSVEKQQSEQNDFTPSVQWFDKKLIALEQVADPD